MKSSERRKDSVAMLRRYADAVIGDRDVPPLVRLLAAYDDHGPGSALELESVAEEILEELHERRGIATNTGHDLHLDLCMTVFDRRCQLDQHSRHDTGKLDGPEGGIGPANTAVGKQRVNKPMHLFGVVHDEVE